MNDTIDRRRAHRAAHEVVLVGLDHVGAQRPLEVEDQAGPDRLDDRRGAALLAVLGVADEAVVRRADVGDGAAAHDVGHPVGEQRPPHDEDPRRARPAHELVRGQEHCVLGRLGVIGPHVDVDVRGPGRVVPERQRPVLVQQAGDRVGVREDAGHVRRGREAADPQRPVGVAHELLGQPRGVDVPVGALRDDHDVGDRLAPGQLVAVVLERADEDHGALVGRDARGQAVPVVEVGREAQVEDPDELVDRAGRARPGEDHGRRVVTAHALLDDPAGVLAQPGRLQPRSAGLGVGVRVARQHLGADEVLDEVQRAPARGVVGVGDPAPSVRALHDLVVADDAGADAGHQRGVGESGVARRDGQPRAGVHGRGARHDGRVEGGHRGMPRSRARIRRSWW